MAAYASSSSGDEFDGFDENDELLAREKLRSDLINIERSCEEVQNEEYHESDISISESESDESGDETDEIDDPFLGNLNADWSGELTDIHLPQFTEETGVKHNLNSDAKPVEYFFKFLPKEFFETLSHETNRYATQKGARNWEPTNAEEMRAFVSVNIIMGIRQLPRISNYWSTDERFSDPYVSSILTKTRFMKINQYIHLRDTSNTPGRDDPNYDPLYKVRTMIDLILPKLKDNYKPGQNLSVDEGMIGFKGRVHFRQYMPAKPTKWGIKVWQICESDSGYCCGFDVYTGKKRDGNRQYGLGYDVVWSLTEAYHNQNRHIYYDRFFSSINLAEHLELVNTYVCGTIMANRKGIPEAVKKAKLKRQGDLVQIQKGNLIATAYKDKRQITFASTCAPPHSNESGKPFVNVLYNKHMGGVDRYDQMCSYYPVGRSGTKWWRYIMWYIINMAIVNSWLLYQKSEKDPAPPKSYDHLQFRMDVADQLRAGYTSRKHRVGRKTKHCNKPIALQSISHHELVKIEGRKRMCRECVHQQRKTASGRPVETTFRCKFCDIPLCKIRCFTSYHDRNAQNN